MQAKTFRSLALLAALLLPAIAHAKDFALITHKANQAKNVTAAEVLKFFKPGASNWPNGTAVVLVLHNPASPEMKLVIQKLGVEDLEAKDFGPKLVVVNSDEEVVQTVARTPGALGIVDIYSITGEVAVVRLDGKLPLEPGYTLRMR